MSNWIRACRAADLGKEEVLQFDHGNRMIAIYHSPDGAYFATDGYCTHERTELTDGLVNGYEIECPRHFGSFDYRTGKAVLAPACIDLKTYKVQVDDEVVFVLID